MSRFKLVCTLPFYFVKIHFNIGITSGYKSSKLSLSFRCTHQNLVRISVFLHTCRTYCPSQPPWFVHQCNTWQEKDFMKAEKPTYNTSQILLDDIFKEYLWFSVLYFTCLFILHNVMYHHKINKLHIMNWNNPFRFIFGTNSPIVAFALRARCLYVQLSVIGRETEAASDWRCF